jgi:hypothetical protein
MNKTEARYARMLDAQRAAGLIRSWAFEAVKLRLAERTFYTPDFFVVGNAAGVEFHEIKGHWEDDARVKIKVAAQLFPMFAFLALRPIKGGGWSREEFKAWGIAHRGNPDIHLASAAPAE